MRFLHTADIHLGAAPDKDLPWGESRRRALWDTFAHLIDICDRKQVDLLLIAGDLFHRTPLSRECREVNAYFSRIPDTRVVIIAGNHDCIRGASPYMDDPWAPNVTVLSSEELDSVYFPELNTEVHGFSYHRSEIREPLYDTLMAPRNGRHHILLAHGGDETHIPIRLGKLAAAGFDYVALGHIHAPRIFQKAAMAYCGSPEPMDRTDIGARGYILGDITPEGCSFRWNPCGTAEYVPVTLEVDEGSTNADIAAKLAETLNPDPRYLYRLTLTGYRDPDTVWEEARIRGDLRIVDITDETRPAFDRERLASEHAHDLAGLLIRTLSEDPDTAGNASEGGPGADDPDIREMALDFGLSALLTPEG